MYQPRDWKTYDGIPYRERNRRKPLSPGLRKLLEYLIYFADRWGVQPSHRTIADYFNVRPSIIGPKLWQLYERGYIGAPEPGYHGVKLFRRPDGSPYWRDTPPAPET